MLSQMCKLSNTLFKVFGTLCVFLLIFALACTQVSSDEALAHFSPIDEFFLVFSGIKSKDRLARVEASR